MALIFLVGEIWLEPSRMAEFRAFRAGIHTHLHPIIVF